MSQFFAFTNNLPSSLRTRAPWKQCERDDFQHKSLNTPTLDAETFSLTNSLEHISFNGEATTSNPSSSHSPYSGGSKFQKEGPHCCSTKLRDNGNDPEMTVHSAPSRVKPLFFSPSLHPIPPLFGEKSLVDSKIRKPQEKFLSSRSIPFDVQCFYHSLEKVEEEDPVLMKAIFNDFEKEECTILHTVPWKENQGDNQYSPKVSDCAQNTDVAHGVVHDDKGRQFPSKLYQQQIEEHHVDMSFETTSRRYSSYSQQHLRSGGGGDSLAFSRTSRHRTKFYANRDCFHSMQNVSILRRASYVLNDPSELEDTDLSDEQYNDRVTRRVQSWLDTCEYPHRQDKHDAVERNCYGAAITSTADKTANKLGNPNFARVYSQEEENDDDKMQTKFYLGTDLPDPKCHDPESTHNNKYLLQ